MLRPRLLITVFSVLLDIAFLQGCASKSEAQQESGEGHAKVSAASSTAAAAALATFQTLVNADNFRELGFESPSEVSGVRLGAPLHVFVVQLDQLQAYEPGSDPNGLLTDIRQDYYPVESDGQARVGIVVEEIEQGWRTASMGNAGLAKRIAAARTAVAESVVPKPAELAVVEVPALGVYFLGHQGKGGRWQLTPLVDQPSLDLKAGATQPADRVFAALLPAAKNYNGLPM